MPKSKNNKSHSERVNNFKSKNKERIMNQQTGQAPTTMPEIRNIPVWEPQATIEVKGFEWEAIQNGLTGVQMGLQAAQSIMSRNILNGTITMDFEKLNPTTLQYEAMSDEDAKPHAEQFNAQVEAFKTAQAAAPVAPTAEPVTDSTPLVEPVAAKIVDMNGSEVTSSK